MSWLWIDCPDRFTVRVDLDSKDNIKTLPPILMKRFKYCFGFHWTYFKLQLEKSYKNVIVNYIKED